MFNSPSFGLQSPRISNDNLMDSVSEMKFGSNDVFATSSWDGYIRFYQIIATNKYRPEVSLEFKTAIDCQEPVLSISWKRDMSIIFAALADNTVRAYDIKSQQNVILGVHEDCPARQVFWNDELQVVSSLGFDKKLKLWSLKQPPMGGRPSPVFEINLTSTPTVGDQDQNYRLFAYSDVDFKIKTLQWEKIRGNMNSVVSRTYFDSDDSRLGNKSQISALSISHDTKQLGYCSVDGRGCVLELNDKFDSSSRIVYKCHKIEEDVKNGYKTEKLNKYFVTNTVQFNPRSYDWLSTGGSDGQLIYWDLKKKNKISSHGFDGPVISSQVSPDGNFIVYAIGYDWGMGLDGLDSRIQNYVQAAYIDDKSLYYLS